VANTTGLRSVIITMRPLRRDPAGTSRGPLTDERTPYVQQGIQALDTRPRRVRTHRLVGVMIAALALLAVAVVAAGLVAAVTAPHSPASAAARTRMPQAQASVLVGAPAVLAASAATHLFASAPTVIVVDARTRTDLAAAARMATRLRAPLLLASTAAGSSGAGRPAKRARPAKPARPAKADRTAGGQGSPSTLLAAVRALHPSTVVAVGLSRQALAATLPGLKVVGNASGLQPVAPATSLRRVAVLVHNAASVTAVAVTATAEAAGAQVIALAGYDPRADPAAIRRLARVKPLRVVAVGAGFGPASRLAARVAVAETGTQLPGGGQVLFPMRKIVALYGNPQSPALGALGQQDLTASIARAKTVAAQYRKLVRVPVIPAFEIIATVAQASPGRSGTYSYVTSVAALRPWIDAATRAGMYVTLDLQPGRANLLTQAKIYRSLLLRPNVGLALDPEWKLGPGQLPLRQIGSVSITEVNSVVTWLARLTARYHLPQKLLELHEFRLSMIQNIQRLDTHYDDLAIVINMDGQGAPSTKQQTWNAVVSNAPRGVFFGWKDFYVKDTPMLGPAATLHHWPQPVLISYQ
jgi:hypothetical protein